MIKEREVATKVSRIPRIAKVVGSMTLSMSLISPEIELVKKPRVGILSEGEIAFAATAAPVPVL